MRMCVFICEHTCIWECMCVCMCVEREREGVCVSASHSSASVSPPDLMYNLWNLS